VAGNYLKEDNIAITSTISPEAKGKVLCNTHMLLSIRVEQLAMDAVRISLGT
jgi:hypothetical protein